MQAGNLAGSARRTYARPGLPAMTNLRPLVRALVPPTHRIQAQLQGTCSPTVCRDDPATRAVICGFTRSDWSDVGRLPTSEYFYPQRPATATHLRLCCATRLPKGHASATQIPRRLFIDSKQVFLVFGHCAAKGVVARLLSYSHARQTWFCWVVLPSESW